MHFLEKALVGFLVRLFLFFHCCGIDAFNQALTQLIFEFAEESVAFFRSV